MGKPEEGFSGVDSVVSGFVLDPKKCNQLSMGEKRELVHEIAQWPEDAPKILSSLTRGQLLELICAEMGKERKYTGYTKFRMIEKLLKLVSNKSTKKNLGNSFAFSPTKTETGHKRQGRQEHQNQLAIDYCVSLKKIKEDNFLVCQNVACSATLAPEDAFCKRCSCCICYQYDDNKDPSLWLTCESNPPHEDPCGMSCHLKCALVHERAGILKNGSCKKLDGNFYCVSCGKINGLMRTWRRQLLVAKEARRVDVLCLRLSLSHKILEGTEQYEDLQRIVETASNKLENEVGPLDLACSKMDRSIVNRLSCNAEVQRLCNMAMEAFDSLSTNQCSQYVDEKESLPLCRIHFEELSPTTVTIVLEYEDRLLDECLGCKLWHRKSAAKDYPKEAAYIVLRPEKRFKLANLSPSTEYSCRVSLFSETQTLGIWEAKWDTPASSECSISILDEQHGEEEHPLVVKAHSHVDSVNCSHNKLASAKYFSELQQVNSNKNDRSLIVMPSSSKNVPLGSPTSDPPSTPCQSDQRTEVSDLRGKKQLGETDYEYSVQVIRWLEHEGYVDREFRVKFLTWFSLKATMRERRVVSVFIDTLTDDPPSLAGQLIDTFADEICREHKPVSRPGLCTRFWH